MSAEEENIFSMVQSRRFACDRCHRQKLRCERSPFVAKGNIIISFGACTRCVKAGVPCHITTQRPGSPPPPADASNEASNSINVDTTTNPTPTTVTTKRKTPPTEIRGEAATGSSSASGYGKSVVSIPAPPSFMQLTSMNDFDMGNISPTFDAALFDTDTVSFPDHGHFETPSGSLPLAPVAPSAAPSSPGHRRPPELDGQRTKDDSETDRLFAFVDPTYFEGSEAHLGESSTKINPDPPQSQNTTATGEHSDANLVGSADEVRRRRLLELHSLLLRELHCITDADLAQAFFSDESTSLPRANAHGNAQMSETNIVRRVLFASERLIDLLNGFCCPCASTPHGQAEHRRSSCSCGATEVHGYHSSVSPTTTAANTISRDTTVFGSVQDSQPSTSLPSMPASPVELPMMMSFLCCYVSLLSVYRAIFTNIHDTIRSALSDSPTTRTPTASFASPFTQASSRNAHPGPFHQHAGSNMEAAVAQKARRPSLLAAGPGEGLARRGDRGHAGARETRHSGVLTQLDPPYITRQRALGIRIQLEVMAHMLDQIEDAWTGMLGSEDTHRQPHSQPDPLLHDATAAELRSSYRRQHQHHHDRHHHHHHQYHHVQQQQQHLQDQDMMDQSPLDSERSGLSLDRTATMQLLQSMLAHEGYSAAEDGQRMGLGSLMEIVENIRKLLRSTRFT